MYLLVKCASVTDSTEEHKQTVLISFEIKGIIHVIKARFS